MTSELTLELLLLAPTCIAQQATTPGQPTASVSYLSGTALRGGLASLWLKGRQPGNLSSDEAAQFAALFASDDLQYGNGWPRFTPTSERERKRWATARTWLVPRSAYTGKDDPGWFGDQAGGVRDALAAMLSATIGSDAWEGWDRLDAEFAAEAQGEWRSIVVRRRLITRTAIGTNEPSSGKREAVADGRLYSLEAIETGQRFMATIRGPDGQINALAALVRAGETTITLGQGASRGLGLARITAINQNDQSQEDRDALPEQLKAFSERAGLPASQRYLPITLESDTILRDRFLIPCASGQPEQTLGRYHPLPSFPMVLANAVQSSRWLGGWDALRNLPRAPQLVVTAGSVWVYEVAAADVLAAIAWWRARELTGIGERRSEGFGRIRLLHPLHAEEAER